MAAVRMSKLRYASLAFNVSAVYITLGLLLSLQPPFYPSEAEKIGATPAQYGFVFGIANLSLFLFGPVFGKFGAKIGPKICFNVGSIVQGVSGFLFAFLPHLKTVGAFISLSYVLRFLEGAGTAMAWSSSLGILMKLFPDKVATMMSWTQTCFGLGYMLGPTVGAALYEAGGFMLPFLVIGLISTFCSIGLIFTIPDLKRIEMANAEAGEEEDIIARDRTGSPLPHSTEDGGDDGADQPLLAPAPPNGHPAHHQNTAANNNCSEEEAPVLRFRTVYLTPRLVLPFIHLFGGLCGTGMLESMLEPHLKASDASTMDTGVTFLIFGCTYMAGNMLLGNLIDRLGEAAYVSMLGNLLYMTTFLFIGPASFLPLNPNLVLIKCMMACAGVAYGALVVSSFTRAQKRVLAMGYLDDMNTKVLMSGVWLSFFALGNFVGPTVAGLIVGDIGFRNTTIVFFCLYIFMFSVDVTEFCCCGGRPRWMRRRRTNAADTSGYQSIG